MAYVESTVASPAIPEIWRAVALKALFSDMVVKNRITSITEAVGQVGDIFHVKINPTPTVGDITAATGAFTAEQVTITEATLTVNKWRYVAHDVVDITDIQADIDLIQNFSQAFIPALGEDIETQILALYSSATTNAAIGDSVSGDAFGDGVILPSILVLDDLKISQKDRSWLIPPVGRAQLLKDDKFVDAHRTGMPKGAMTNGIFSDIYGTPSYVSPLVATSGSIRKAMYLHKEGLMVGIQKNMKIEKFSRVQFSTPIAASVLYGVGVLRNNHVQVVNLKTTLV